MSAIVDSKTILERMNSFLDEKRGQRLANKNYDLEIRRIHTLFRGCVVDRKGWDHSLVSIFDQEPSPVFPSSYPRAANDYYEALERIFDAGFVVE